MSQYSVAYQEVIGNSTTIEQAIPIFHKTFYIPSILTMLIFYSLIILILGIVSITNYQGRAKFFKIWIIGTILTTSFAILIMFKPSIIAFIAGMFS